VYNRNAATSPERFSLGKQRSGPGTGNIPGWRLDASSSMKHRERIMAVIPKPYGNASYQLVDHGVVVGLILRTPEVLWGVYDLNRNRIGRLSFDAPEQAAAHFEAFRSAS
jgi:hypothetical protein